MTDVVNLGGGATIQVGDPDQVVAPLVEIDAGTAISAVDLLAHWWSRPTDDEVALWRSGVGNEVFVFGRMGEPDRRLTSDLVDAAALRDGYERLFVGPGPVPCPPYESYWRNDVSADIRRSLMGPCTVDLARIYGDVGLMIKAGSGGMPDHVAIEFEALAFAMALEGGQAASRELFFGHLNRWIPQLCRAVRRGEVSAFYTDLANVTLQWIKSIQQHLEATAPSDAPVD